MYHLIAPTRTTATIASNTPPAVTAARTVTIVQGVILLAAGAMLASAPGYEVLGVASIVEGVVRIALGVGLRRNARRTRKGLLVLSVLGAFFGFAAGGLSLIGGVLSVVVGRLLLREDSKEFLGS